MSSDPGDEGSQGSVRRTSQADIVISGSGSQANIYLKSSGEAEAAGSDLREIRSVEKADQPDKVSISGDIAHANVYVGETTPPAAGAGRKYYEAYIAQVLDGAITRKGAIEQRGISVVTTAGTLVTAVFAVVSFVLAHTGSKILNPHAIIRGSIDWAAILFVIAAILGLLVNIPVPYGDPDPSELASVLLASSDNTANDHPREGRGPDSASGPAKIVPAEPSEQSINSRFLTASENQAAWEISATRVKLLYQARRLNLLKAQFLFAAVLSEVVAIGFLAWGVHRLLGI